MTDSSSAASRTVRASGATWASVGVADTGYTGTRPNWALMPTRPHSEAGMRIEPPPSVPSAQRRHARRHAGRRAGAGAARRLGPVPGVAGDAAQRRVAHRLAAEFAGGGLADDAGAGRAHAFDRGRIRRRHVVGHGARAKGVGQALDGNQVLDRDRQAMQGTEGLARHQGLLGLPGGLQCLLRRIGGETVQAGVEALDARQRGLHQFDR